MAGQDRKEGLVMDEAIYNSHKGNEDFYAKVSEMITEKIRIRQGEKGKDGFTDCIKDDKTRLSYMQNATRTTRNNVLEDINRENTNYQHNLE